MPTLFYRAHSWVFGINGKNFIKTMLNVGKTHDTLKVVSDQSAHRPIPMIWRACW